jgi:sec-independent protein translocase protein TatB
VFDIGFTELMICLVVALVVIGPERLPETVRSVSLWVGRLKRSLRETRSEFERQIGADEIRRQLQNEEIMERIEKARIEMETTYNNILNETQQALDADDNKQPLTLTHEELPDHAHGPEHNAPALAATPAEEPTSTGNSDSAESTSSTESADTTESTKQGHS